MITATYVLLTLFLIGLILVLIPKNWYSKSTHDFRRLGAWLGSMSFSATIFMYLGYIIYLIYNAIYTALYSIGK
jgi:uncharacterized membrane protein